MPFELNHRLLGLYQVDSVALKWKALVPLPGRA
jgi:hypothetical protein